VSDERAGRRRLWWGIGAGIGATALVLGLLAVLVMTGVLWPNRLTASRFDVRGVDVSAYQGTIDWPTLAGQDLDFAFVKATEGSSHVDRRFAANWSGARDAGLVVGAYHFLSFESPGAGQAEHVVDTVPAEPGTLPPVVDLELYGEFVGDPPDLDTARGILDPLLERLEEHYGAPPIIYTTQQMHDDYLADDYDAYPLWIRSVATSPDLPRHRWTFWQYSDRDHLDGYDGVEEHIDMNVFDGTLDDLRAMTLSP
jgi:lysozyme